MQAFILLLILFVFAILFILPIIRNISSEGGHPFDSAYNEMIRRQKEEEEKRNAENTREYKEKLDSELQVINESPASLLARITGLSQEELLSTPCDYKKQSIPKKTGGVRNLLVPNPALKKVQKKLQRFIEERFQANIHFTCHSYRTDKSIMTNAAPHIGNAVLIKLDIRNYFENITPNQVKKVLTLGSDTYAYHKNFQGFNRYIPEELSNAKDYLDYEGNFETLIKLIHSDNGLPQGAPSSPIISNLVLAEFDHEMFLLVKSIGGKYTRYSDDISVSFKQDDKQKIAYVIKMVDKKLCEYGFQLNKKKGKIHVLRKHQAQRICGITINSGLPTISRKQRRLIRAAQHNASKGLKTTYTESQIKGHQSFHSYVADKGVAMMSEATLKLESRNAQAYGISNGRQFTMLRGSIFAARPSDDDANTIFQTMLSELIENNIVKPISNNRYRFTKNHTFNSKTEATSLLFQKKTSPTGKWN